MPTILVADDDANIRELVCLFLHNDGFATSRSRGRQGSTGYLCLNAMSILSYLIL